jgi:hypothetical protein
MSLNDLVVGLAAGSVATGIVSFIIYRVRFKRQSKISYSTPITKQLTIPEEEAKNAKQEVKTLLLEKDLLSSAITRVFELEAQGQISKDERDFLVKKYKEQLQEVDKKLESLELIIEVSELENLRNELVNLLSRKIDEVDKKLEKAISRLDMQKIKSTPQIPSSEKVTQPAPSQTTKVEKRPSKPLESSIERELKRYREEILKALEKLEQIDVEETT